jgi:hypothetical protein
MHLPLSGLTVRTSQYQAHPQLAPRYNPVTGSLDPADAVAVLAVRPLEILRQHSAQHDSGPSSSPFVSISSTTPWVASADLNAKQRAHAVQASMELAQDAERAAGMPRYTALARELRLTADVCSL